MTWRPLPSALLFAILGPLVGAGLVLLLLAPAIANLGPFDPPRRSISCSVRS
ncbi:MAG: hypothetical protein KIT43_04050 [Bauldia sp.]|nr:hypothetical protein [Bauldia sp.]